MWGVWTVMDVRRGGGGEGYTHYANLAQSWPGRGVACGAVALSSAPCGWTTLPEETGLETVLLKNMVFVSFFFVIFFILVAF